MVAVALDLSDVREAVAGVLVGEHPDSDVSRAGVLLLSACEVGTAPAQLRAFTGLPWSVIKSGGFFARRAGIWSMDGGDVLLVVEWEEPDPLGAMAFILDCMAVAGRIVRETTFDTYGAPKVRYRQRLLGDYSLVQTEGMESVPWEDVARPDLREQRRLRRVRPAMTP